MFIRDSANKSTLNLECFWSITPFTLVKLWCMVAQAVYGYGQFAGLIPLLWVISLTHAGPGVTNGDLHVLPGNYNK